MSAAHRCHVPQCRKRVDRKMLMCRPHWFKVPKHLRDAVWDHYQDGQENGEVVPSDEWHEAAHAAIESVKPKPKPGRKP